MLGLQGDQYFHIKIEDSLKNITLIKGLTAQRAQYYVSLKRRCICRHSFDHSNAKRMIAMGRLLPIHGYVVLEWRWLW